MVEKQQIIDTLMKVNDPEIMIDVWTLGLIYDIKIESEVVDIKMTFTSPMCPYGPMLVDDVKSQVGKIDGIKETKVEVTFEPPWKPSEELRDILGV
jgi:metal-sulfur cluster biosynthetic enzyme